MDNTELHYVTYDPETIWDTMMATYVAAGGDILYPGDEKEMLLRSVQSVVVQAFAGVDNALRMQTLRYATGDYLDILGELRGCDRIAAQTATATVIITTEESSVSHTIDAGTRMTQDGEVYYELTDALTIAGKDTSTTATITAVDSGTSGNGLLSGAVLQLTESEDYIVSIVCSESASGGAAEEDDDTYRERIRTYGMTSITTGPAQQYEANTKEVSTNILDAHAVNEGDGEVGVYVIIDESETSETLLAEIEAALSADDVRPLTDHVTVQKATNITYTINVTYETDGASIETAVSEAVEEYQDWQDNTIGRAFNPDKLISLLYQAGATHVVFGSDSVFNGSSTIEYTEIESNERCIGTISISVAS